MENCGYAYETYKALVKKLGRYPTAAELIRMTAIAEAWGILHSSIATNTEAGLAAFQEGLARAYYSACGPTGSKCDEPGDALYTFLSGYQPWLGRTCDGSGGHCVTDTARAAQKADKLISYLSYQDSTTDDLDTFVDEILGSYAQDMQWTTGRQDNKPWQWFTYSAASNPYQNPTFGNGNQDLYLQVSYTDPIKGGTYYLYFFTGEQTKRRKK